jgi:hypothetical protein
MDLIHKDVQVAGAWSSRRRIFAVLGLLGTLVLVVLMVLIIARSFIMLAGLLTAMVTVFRCHRALRLMPGGPVISSPGHGGL